MANRNWKLNVYDRNTVDYDMMQQADQEAIEISSPPIMVYRFNMEKTLKGKQSNIDTVYNEFDMMDEEKIMEMYNEGFNEQFDASIVREGEQFDPCVRTYGYYQEPTWTNELSRLGFEDVEEELAITFNYKKLLADLGREIRIGDVIKTFRGKIYRVTSAYPADEVIGWKYLHFNVICIKPKEIDFLNLPDDPIIPNGSNTGI